MAKMVTITGNTYPVKEALKALGARWNADAKGWDVPAEKENEARMLVANGPGAAPQQRNEYRPQRCRECGVNAKSLRAPYEKILRNGLCSGCNADRKAGYD